MMSDSIRIYDSNGHACACAGDWGGEGRPTTSTLSLFLSRNLLHAGVQQLRAERTPTSDRALTTPAPSTDCTQSESHTTLFTRIWQKHRYTICHIKNKEHKPPHSTATMAVRLTIAPSRHPRQHQLQKLDTQKTTSYPK